jgi:hypothetical protein
MNRQVLLATDPEVELNVGVGGVPTPGQTRVTLDSGQIVYTPGSNDLFVFLNGQLRVLGTDYIEEDSTHIVFTFLLDDVGPQIDTIEVRAAQQGSSEFIQPPDTFSQVKPPQRPDNFGGLFSFDP